MHQFVIETDGYGVTRLLYREQHAESVQTALFHVEGPSDPYEQALTEDSSVQAFECRSCPDTSFYVYVRSTMSNTEQALAGAFSHPGLLVVTPVEYHPDGTVRVTAVGPADAIQTAVDAVPETMGVEVEAVGDYAGGRLDPRLELTQRQFEAIQAAVDSGYYSAPREGSLEDVAERLDCASGTAGQLLRRAERTVMTGLVAGGPF